MKQTEYDILIIGGGINGCGIARELAGRGYQVILCEKNDIASATSSWSTKLIHGGLRYLEHYKFRLVRESLKERDILMGMAPHLIQPLRFVLPYMPGMRPKWLLRLALFLYDHLGGKSRLPASSTVDLHKDDAGQALKDALTYGFEYSDCFVDDSRLTLANARSAADLGAEICRDCAVLHLERISEGWQVKTAQGVLTAKIVINASGPFADQVLSLQAGGQTKKHIRLVRGSHLITKRLFTHEKAYIFQNTDGRILFALPYLDAFTLLGTTDIDHDGKADAPQISQNEIEYLLTELSRYLKKPLSKSQIIATYSGVRPLFDDARQAAQSVTRDYILSWQPDSEKCWLNIFGGKLTTYRQLALKVAKMVDQTLPAPFPNGPSSSCLPGGDIPNADFASFLSRLKTDFPVLPAQMITRMAYAYGTNIYQIIGTASHPKALGLEFGLGLYQAEVDYLVQQEWARTPEDILARRTKLGLNFDAKITEQLGKYLAISRPTP
jgi:glycerol-3-phosphate dehydrogenase